MHKLLLIILIATLPTLGSDKEYGNLTVSEVISVYDGDTFKVNIDDVHAIVGDTVSIRIKGIDTPERRGTPPEIKEMAFEARDALQALLESAETIELREVSRGKYFRILATVYCDSVNVAEYMIDNGYAQPYFGGTRPEW